MLTNIICLDFEASALSDKSYPIEVGVCNAATTEVRSWLIKPTDKWQGEGEWVEKGVDVHNIPYADLINKGLPVELVAKELTAYCRGKHILSDAPSYDAFWLARLYAALGQPAPFQLFDFYDYAHKLAVRKGRRYDIAYAKAEQEAAITCPYKHRAGADARNRAEILRQIAGISV